MTNMKELPFEKIHFSIGNVLELLVPFPDSPSSSHTSLAAACFLGL